MTTRNIQTEAPRFFDDLKSGNDQANLRRAVRDVEDTRTQMSPREYNQYLNELNQETASSLPALEIHCDAADRCERKGNTAVTVNDRNEITSVTDQDGRVFTRRDDGTWSLSEAGIDIGTVKNLAVDDQGNISYDIGRTHVTFRADGEIWNVDEATGEKIVRDHTGRVTEAPAGDGQTRKFHYDQNGNVDQIDGRLGHWDRVDAEGKTAWVNRNSGELWKGQFTVDDDGNLHFKSDDGAAWKFTKTGQDVREAAS